ncbi:MAG TPA: ORF6N domain-containing protein [Candidatus Cloacimonadota bacterium]|jgi:hypothetical protein|nr:ORF6N domain-containing protein [Candidatus Cloacimonadota bacterium]
MKNALPTVPVDNLILEIRGQKVITDADLARLYEVETKRLNEQVKRNMERFPEDFMFQLSEDEFHVLKSHFATSSWGGRRSLPYVFTEHGAIMAASVLNSPRAVEMSVYVVRAFVNLRAHILQYKELSQKVSELEAKLGKHDENIVAIVNALKLLMEPPKAKKKEIGFKQS